jgi:hypothetical protein
MMGPWSQDGPVAPHKVLNAYVDRLTGFTPCDGYQSDLERNQMSNPLRSTIFNGIGSKMVHPNVSLEDTG